MISYSNIVLKFVLRLLLKSYGSAGTASLFLALLLLRALRRSKENHASISMQHGVMCQVHSPQREDRVIAQGLVSLMLSQTESTPRLWRRSGE